MSGAVTAIATAVSAAAANAFAAGTVLLTGEAASSAAIEAVSTFAYTAATIGVTTGISAGIGAAFAPKTPDPQALQFPLKQPMPIRQSAIGRVRVAGAYVLYVTGTTHSNISYDVLALLDGQSAGVVGYYLNDDLMAKTSSGTYWWAPGAPGKYGGGGSNEPNLVKIDSRLGLATETAYAISADVPLWDSSHRGDGVTSMLLQCTQARREDQAGDFPNGLPTPSAVVDAQLIYDPRDTSQTQGDASTYVFSDNPVLGLLAYLTDASGGMGLDYARFILPAVDFWKTAADECDGLVATSGMHATLLDAAAPGDSKLFLADQTGLAAGTVIALADGQTVTVSALATAGEVDLTGTLTNAHTAGELAYWNAAGQAARYRCAGTYGHDTNPGDVVKSILQTFDGWLGQRGDGALVVRTNTLYTPTVVLGDRHIVGYQLQTYLPDEQATNQYVVSYTDPASAFNKAEAGYVEDDVDIAARGVVRSSELYLQWCPSGPQAIAVARAMLARATQPLRGTVTCNLAGLAVMGDRYVGLQISEIPALADAVVEITGKATIDLASMTVSFPFVVAGYRSNSASQALCFVLDITKNAVGAPAGIMAKMQEGVGNALSLIGATYGAGLDICIVAFGDGPGVSSITKRSASAGDIADMIAWVDALTQSTNAGFDAAACLTEAKAFFDATDPSVTALRTVFVWDGIADYGGAGAVTANQAAAHAVAVSMIGAAINVINIELSDTSYALDIDNTPDDGVPYAPEPDQLFTAIEQAVFGSSSTPGSGYTLPPLAPPSGSPLQPLAAPAITSVTPDYPNSGGGVQGARLSIVVADPGPAATWKVQWKLAADSVWTDAGSSITATDLPPLTILTGLIPASGSIDVQVAYVTATQTSPWSATTTATVAAALGGVASAAKTAGFTTTADVNVYYVDTASAAVTVTLNAAPAANETVEVWDSTGHAGTNPISFDGAGKTIAGSATVADFIAINFGRARLIYDGTQWLMQ